MLSAIPFDTVVSAGPTTRLMARLDYLKTELGITVSTYDAQLVEKIAAASEKIIEYCGREFAKVTLSDEFRLDRSVDSLIISRDPVASITSITEDGTALTASDYKLTGDRGGVRKWELWRVDSFGKLKPWTCRGPILVAYVGGFEMVTDLPRSLEDACVSIIKVAWATQGQNPLIKGEDVPGVGSVQYWVGGMPGDNAALPPEAVALLSKYVRTEV